MSRRASLTVEEASSLWRLEDVAPAWGALYERCRYATPFSSPGWMLAWCRAFDVDAPRALLLWRGGELDGLAVFVDYTMGDLRALGLAGGGVSDYQDVLLAPGAEDQGARVLLAALARGGDPVDVALLEQLPSSSPLLRAPPPGGWRAAVEPQFPCPVLALPRSLDALAGVASPRLLENLLYARRRLARSGEVTVEHAREDNLERLLDALFRLHRARWAARGLPGAVWEDRVEGFHREAARGLLGRGALRLFALRVDGRPIAVHYGFTDKGRAYYYLGGFDPAWAKLSPGTLALGEALEQAIREGARELDFLRGAEPYKRAWGAEERHSSALRLDRAGARSEAAAPP